eukprot:COSAG01_NODE_8414_length_2791_cov_2.495171_4_plen_128_part_00
MSLWSDRVTDVHPSFFTTRHASMGIDDCPPLMWIVRWLSPCTTGRAHARTDAAAELKQAEAVKEAANAAKQSELALARAGSARQAQGTELLNPLALLAQLEQQLPDDGAPPPADADRKTPRLPTHAP